MFRLPNSSANFKLACIDPGSDTLGISLLSYDHYTRHAVIEESVTLHASKKLSYYRHLADYLDPMQIRLLQLEPDIVQLLNDWQPHEVCTEGPYLGQNVSTYGKLTEVIAMIKSAVRTYDQLLKLAIIDPATVKKFVGVPGNSGDKSLMRRALERLDTISFRSGLTIDDLSEHAVDSVLVGHYMLRNVYHRK